MRATIATINPKNIQVRIELEMSMEEAEALAFAVADVNKWPMPDFRTLLRTIIKNAHDTKTFNQTPEL